MKRLEISEGDLEIFRGEITQEEWAFLEDHKEPFQSMWKEQGNIFWMNTVVKYRMCKLKFAFGTYSDVTMNRAKDYPFIRIAENMTSSFGDVMEFMTDVIVVLRNMHLVTNMTRKTCTYDPFVHPATRNSFRNLFGPADSKLRIFRTHLYSHIYFSWVGAVVRLLRRWLTAPRSAAEAVRWSPPLEYVAPSEFQPALFERYLKQKWKSRIAEVCGAPAGQLLWWPHVSEYGSLEPPAAEEFRAMMDMMPLHEPAAAAAAPERNGSPARAGRRKGKRKAAAKAGNKADKPNKEASASKCNDEPKSDVSRAPAAATWALAESPDLLPAASAEVVAATLDWHEYVTARVGNKQLVRQQMLGGVICLGWLGSLLSDAVVHLMHFSDEERTQLLAEALRTREWESSAKTALLVEYSADKLRTERDALATRIALSTKVVDAMSSWRDVPGPTMPNVQLAHIRGVVRKALDSPLLAEYPVLYQYSAGEAPIGEGRLVYPDFSRWSFLVRKGLRMLSTPMPELTVETVSVFYETTCAAMEWCNDLHALPLAAFAHEELQLRAGGVLARRQAQPSLFAVLNAKLGPLEFDLAQSEWLSALRQTLEAVRDLCGPDLLPRRPAPLRAHTSQSLVDAYWAQLFAMVFVLDLLSLLPASVEHQELLACFTQRILTELLDTVSDLQVAAWRWLYSRIELELPQRPAFAQPAGKQLLERCLDHAEAQLRTARLNLRNVFRAYSICLDDGGKAIRVPEKHYAVFVKDFGDYGAEGLNLTLWPQGKDIPNAVLMLAAQNQFGTRTAEAGDIRTTVEATPTALSYLVTIMDCRDLRKFATFGKSMAKKLTDVLLQQQKWLKCTRSDVVTVSCLKPKDHGKTRYPMHPEDCVRACMAGFWRLLVEQVRQHALQERQLDGAACRTALNMAGSLFGLRVVCAGLPVEPFPPLPASQRLFLHADWRQLLAQADADVGDWRSWVAAPEAAAALLAAGGRPQLERACLAACVRRVGGAGDAPQCGHTGTERLLCMCLSTLRSIRFVERFVALLGPGAEITVHHTMLNIMREAWLPCLLAALRLAGAPDWKDHVMLVGVLLNSVDGWLDTKLGELYRLPQKLGKGRMMHADRSWLIEKTLRPDMTVCRTVSWSQACDLHLLVMKTLATCLSRLRMAVPAVTGVLCEVHLAPLALFELVETGAVLLLTAFLDLRDGGSADQVADIMQLPPEVALALDLRAWLCLVDDAVTKALRDVGRPTPPPTSEQLSLALGWAMTSYEHPLRHGSLLEFLALRQQHAEQLRWVVRALRLHAEGRQQQDAAVQELCDRVQAAPRYPLALLPIADLKSSAQQKGSLPFSWMVRLQQLRHVLVTPRLPLLDSVLVVLDYELDYGPMGLPPFEPAPTLTGPDIFEVERIDAVALCDYVRDIGLLLLAKHTNGKLHHYRARDDFIVTGRRYFVKPYSGGEAAVPRDVAEWAATNVRRIPRARRVAPATAAATGGDTTATGEARPEIKPEAIDNMYKRLVKLITSPNQLSDIPEEPLERDVLLSTERYASELAKCLESVPDAGLRDRSLRLAKYVEKTARDQRTGRLASRTVAGSEMVVVDLCLSTLATVLKQNGLDAPAPPADQQPPAAPPSCSFCERRQAATVELHPCPLCVSEGASEPKLYCGIACQTDDWEMGHNEDHH